MFKIIVFDFLYIFNKKGVRGQGWLVMVFIMLFISLSVCLLTYSYYTLFNVYDSDINLFLLQIISWIYFLKFFVIVFIYIRILVMNLSVVYDVYSYYDISKSRFLNSLIIVFIGLIIVFINVLLFISLKSLWFYGFIGILFIIKVIFLIKFLGYDLFFLSRVYYYLFVVKISIKKLVIFMFYRGDEIRLVMFNFYNKLYSIFDFSINRGFIDRVRGSSSDLCFLFKNCPIDFLLFMMLNIFIISCLFI